MDECCIRKAHLDDSEFVFATKEKAVHEYAEQVSGWDESHQRELHNTRFASHDLRIIQFRGIGVGFFASSGSSEVVKLHQLFILPEFQGRGIGSACTTRIIYEASVEQKPVMLGALKINTRAIAFYQRLGFVIADPHSTHVQMEKLPE